MESDKCAIRESQINAIRTTLLGQELGVKGWLQTFPLSQNRNCGPVPSWSELVSFDSVDLKGTILWRISWPQGFVASVTQRGRIICPAQCGPNSCGPAQQQQLAWPACWVSFKSKSSKKKVLNKVTLNIRLTKSWIDHYCKSFALPTCHHNLTRTNISLLLI